MVIHGNSLAYLLNQSRLYGVRASKGRGTSGALPTTIALLAMEASTRVSTPSSRRPLPCAVGVQALGLSHLQEPLLLHLLQLHPDT